MKLLIKLNCLEIEPESDLDRAYLNDTLGCSRTRPKTLVVSRCDISWSDFYLRIEGQ